MDRPSQPRRRRRPALSCLECRRRKIKCDRNDPCAHCVSARMTCNFRTYSSEPIHGRSQRDLQSSSSAALLSPSATAPSPSTQAEQPSRNETITAPTTTPVPNLQENAISVTGRNEPTSLLPTDVQRASRIDDGGSGRLSSSALRVTNGISETERDALSRPAEGIQQYSELVLNKSRMQRYRLGIAREFAPVFSCYLAAIEHGSGVAMMLGQEGQSAFQSNDTADYITQMRDLLRKCKDLAGQIKFCQRSGVTCSPESNLPLPSREMADAMATLYFQHFESTHRIVHAPTFWVEFKQFWSQPEGISVGTRLTVLLVIAIGSSVHGQGEESAQSHFRNLAHQWIDAAQAWLSGPLKKGRLNIMGLQIHCLTILARQIFSAGGDLVWVSVGELIHKAMQMGLHRDPSQLRTLSTYEREMRRRLWATILELTVQSSLDAAMPPRISLEEFDTAPPSNINDEELDEATTTVKPHAREIYTTTSIQLTLLDSLPTRLQVVQLLHGLHSEVSYLDVLSLSAALTNACRAAHQFATERNPSGTTPFRRNLLDFLVRRFLLPLHCPFATCAQTNPMFYSSVKVSLDAAMAILSPEPDDAFSRLMARGGEIFKESFRSSMTAVTLELLVQTEAQRLDGTLRRNPQYRGMLERAMRDMMELSAKRIQQGETNVKGHMFLSMILAQAHAIEHESEKELEIAKSGKESLRFCYDLLSLRAASVPPLDGHVMDGSWATPEEELEGFGVDLDWDLFQPDAGYV